MAIYTVLAPETRDGAPAADAMRTVFVKEGFAWPALFFAWLWLIYRRMWLVLVGYVVLAFVVGLIERQTGGNLASVFLVMTHFLLALEGNELRRWTLFRRGYKFVGVAEGRGIEEAEIHFFSSLAQAAPASATPPGSPLPPPRTVPRLGPLAPSAEAGDVVGLFPAPGGAS
jgi:hypothetical protein